MIVEKISLNNGTGSGIKVELEILERTDNAKNPGVHEDMNGKEVLELMF